MANRSKAALLLAVAVLAVAAGPGSAPRKALPGSPAPAWLAAPPQPSLEAAGRVGPAGPAAAAGLPGGDVGTERARRAALRAGSAAAPALPPNRLPGGGFAYNPLLNAGDGIERPAASAARAADAVGTYLVLFEEPALGAYLGGTAGIDMPPRELHATGKSRVDARSLEASHYLGYLQGRQLMLEDQMASLAGGRLAVRWRMQHAVNGIVADMTAGQSRLVAGMPGVRLVEGYRRYRLQGESGPALIGAPIAWAGSDPFGPGAVQGEGMLVGVIDSGINFGSPSFAAVDPVDGYVHANPLGEGNYLGTCAQGGDDEGRCNGKLVGGHDFVCGAPGYLCGAFDASEEPGFGDNTGHGTHVASTAAGNRRDVVYSGAAVRISGVAPRASVVAYDACFLETSTGYRWCPNVSLVAAINQAVVDGVDVINYSIDGGWEPWLEAPSLALLDAVDAGIYVATSSGFSTFLNGYPGHLEPWVSSTTSVHHGGAAFQTRMSATAPSSSPLATLMLDNGTGGAELGATLPASTPLRISPGFDGASDGCSPYAGSFAGAVVVVRRGTCTYTEKASHAAAAGAIAVVFSNSSQVARLFPSTNGATIPVFGTTRESGDLLRAYVDANADATVELRLPSVREPNTPDVLTSLGTLGASGYDVLKPDLAAPGFRVLAAAAGPTVTGHEGALALYSGSSMASANNAGAALLLRQARPAWTPTEVQSALMLTAKTPVYVPGSLTPAGPFERGSGRIRLERALKSGLVMHETAANFRAADPAVGGDTSSLNLASLVDGDCFPDCRFTRTFRNPLTAGSLWRIEVDGLPGAVDSPLAWIPAGAMRTIKVTIDGRSITRMGRYFDTGRLVLTPLLSGANASPAAALELPIAVSLLPPQLVLPPSLQASVPANGSSAVPFDLGNAGGVPLMWQYEGQGEGYRDVLAARRSASGVAYPSTAYTDPGPGPVARFAADDFELPQASLVYNFRVDGLVASGAELGEVSSEFTFSIYADAGGLPAGNPLSTAVAPLWTFTTDQYAFIYLAQGGAIEFAPPAPVDLPAGRYWLVVNTRSRVADGWSAYGSDAGNGSVARIGVDAAGAGTWVLDASSAGLAMTVGITAPCGAPWMGPPVPASGTVAPKSSTPLVLPVNAAGLAPGAYAGSACFNGRLLPVRLDVTP